MSYVRCCVDHHIATIPTAKTTAGSFIMQSHTVEELSARVVESKPFVCSFMRSSNLHAADDQRKFAAQPSEIPVPNAKPGITRTLMSNLGPNIALLVHTKVAHSTIPVFRRKRPTHSQVKLEHSIKSPNKHARQQW